jgi:HlyD family secretion protein
MTATADISVAEARNVWLVPVAAFRFDPADAAAQAFGGQSKTFAQSLVPMPPRRQNRRPGNGDSGEKTANGAARIHILKDGHPHPLTVHVGLTDGRHTEISADTLAADLQIITNAR